jgi:glycosyltransferase involved in cell wall biosynthesis
MAGIKICVLIPGFGMGGAQKQCAYLLNELQRDKELDIHLVYFYEDINFEYLHQDNLVMHQLKASSFYNPANIAKILKVVREINPDILFSWLHSSDVYSYFISKLFGKAKWIMTERDSHYPPEFRYKLRNRLGKNADLIISNSAKGRLYWLNKGAAPDDVKVIGNIMIPAVKSKPLALKGNPVITYAGRLEPQKNVINLTKAFCLLSGIYPDAQFLIIGAGSLKDDLAGIISGAGGSARISLVPYQKNVNDYFSSTDVFVSISAHEGLPNTIMENIYLGNKIVASRIPEHEAILGNDYPYFSDDIENVDNVVKVVTAILAETNIAKHLEYGKMQLKAMSAENIGAKYKEMFNHVLLT